MTGGERCDWAQDPVHHAYHDQEWGVPIHDDQRWFEFVTLEGAQAGLSWRTILTKRDRYREQFADFDPAVVATFDQAREAELLNDAGLVRNRLKIASTITNARHFLDVQAQHGSFDAFIWGFVDDSPIMNRWQTMDQVPASSVVSDRISRALKQRGFRFVGTTICYALMQAGGLVNDHLISCFRHAELANE